MAEKEKIFSEFTRIMLNEGRLSTGIRIHGYEGYQEMFYNLVRSVIETCKLSFIGRSYNTAYHLAENDEVFESVGAHTNFSCEILRSFLSYYYGPNAHILDCDEEYTYNEAIEAMSRHDKPEAKLGDIPDNGGRNEADKRRSEDLYQLWLSKLSPLGSGYAEFEIHVLRLLRQMNEKDTLIGRAMYLSDKISALLTNLYLDSVGKSPYRTTNDNGLTKRDTEEIRLIAKQYRIHDVGYHYKASEMWSMDYFKFRAIIDYDDTGFFTALLVMYTLVINGHWYDWREADY